VPETFTDYERERARVDAQNLMNLGAGWGQKLYPHQAKGPLSDFEPTIEDIQTTWSQTVGDTQFKESPDWRQSSFGIDPGNAARAWEKAKGKEIQPASWPQPTFGSWEKLDEQGKMAHAFQVVEKAMEEDEKFKNEVEYDFDQALIRRIPFAGSAAEVAEQLDLGDRAQRITQGKGTVRDYLEIAKVMHNADYWENEAGYGEHAVKDVSSIVTFGAEFAMTAGTGSLAKKVGAKVATNLVGKLGLKALLKKYAGLSVKKLLSPTNLKRSLVMGPTMAASTYHSGRGNIGQLEATQEGGFEFAEEEDSAALDAFEAAAMAYAEIAIEELLPHGFADKLTGGMKSKLTRGIANLFGREASERTGKGMMRRAGLGSLAEELTEERMVELANTAITRDPDELGVLAGDLKAFSHEAVAMSLVQTPGYVSALMPGRSRQQRIDRQTPTEPPALEEGQVIPLEPQEVIPEVELAPPLQPHEVIPEDELEPQWETDQQYDPEGHIDMLAAEGRSSRREFELVKLPDGTTLQDKYPSKTARDEFLEQRRAEIVAREAPIEQPSPEEAPDVVGWVIGRGESNDTRWNNVDELTQGDAAQQQAIEDAVENGELQVGYDKEGNQWVAKAGEAHPRKYSYQPHQKFVYELNSVIDALDEQELIHTNPELQQVLDDVPRNVKDLAPEEQQSILDELSSYLPVSADAPQPAAVEAQQEAEQTQPSKPKPYQQTEDEYIESVSQSDVVNVEDPQMTEHEMNVLGGESKNVKMPVSSQQLPYVVKENPDGGLVAVVDNQVVGYARTVDGALDLHVADEFKGHEMEQELTTLFQDMNPDVTDITNNTRDTLLAGHALSVDQALKSGQPVPLGVAKIREAQQRVEATQAKIDDGRKVTPQLRAALTRGQDNLDRARVEFGQPIPDRASRVDELAQRVEEGRDLFTGEPLEGTEAAEAAVPEATKPKGSTIAQFRAERAEQTEQEIEPSPVIEETPSVSVVDAEQDIKDVRTASVVNLQDIRREFRGMKVVEVEDGFIIHNPRGKIHVKLVEESELTDRQIMVIWDDHQKSWVGKKNFRRNSSGKWLTFREVFPTAESYLENFRRREKEGEFIGTIAPATKEQTDSDFSLLATIRLNNTDWGRQQGTAMTTLRHELVHMAFNSGMWTTKERAALVKKYSDTSKSFRVQSEDIALASEYWKTPGAIQKLTDFINRLLSKITGGVVKLKPQAVENLLFHEKFWDPDVGREASSWKGVMGEAQGMPSGKEDLQQTQDQTKTQEQETTDDKQRSTGLPQQTQETSSQAGRFPDRGRLPRGSEQLSPLRRSSVTSPALEGLPTKIAIRSYPDAVIEPDEVARTAAAVYMDRIDQEYNPPKKYAKIDKELAGRIADWYETVEHDPSNPKIAESYQAMIEETLAQWEVIKETGLKVEWIDLDKTGNPYASTPREATEDIRRNNHFWVFPTDDGFGTEGDFDPKDNPLFEYTDEVIDGRRVRANDIFRIVHDYFGHVKEGNGFRAGGEENAWRSHVAMYSDLAKPAMTMETRGQNSWLNFGPSGDFNRTADQAETVYADQKINIPPPKFVEQGAADALLPMGQPLPAEETKEGELPESQSRWPDGRSIPSKIAKVREVIKKQRGEQSKDVIPEEEVKDLIDELRRENPDADQELMDRLNEEGVAYDVFDDYHAYVILEERGLSTEEADMELVGELSDARDYARANAGRVLGASWNKDPLEQESLSEPEKRHHIILDMIGAKSPESRLAWQELAAEDEVGEGGTGTGGKKPGKKGKEATDEADTGKPGTKRGAKGEGGKAWELGEKARKAHENEKARLRRMKEFVEGLGYSFDVSGLKKLAQSREDSQLLINENRDIMLDQGWPKWVADLLTEYHLAAMLQGFRTTVTNVAGMTFGGYREGERFGSALLNTLTRNTKDITISDFKHYHAENIPIGMWYGFKNALKSFANFFIDNKYELIEDVTGVKSEVDWDAMNKSVMPRTAFGINARIPVLYPTGKQVRNLNKAIGFGGLQMGDQFFRTLFIYQNVGIEASRIARNEGLKGEEHEARVQELIDNPRSMAWEAAANEAKIRLLQDRGPEGGWSDRTLKMIEMGTKMPSGGGWFFKNFVVPFSKVPLRIPSQQFVRIPVVGFRVYHKMYQNYFKDNKHPLEGVSNEIVGQFMFSLMMWSLYGLVDCDDEKTKITGAARDFDRSGRKFRYEKGVKEGQTLEIGDVDYSYDRVDPAAGWIATAVDFIRAYKCADSLTEGVEAMGKSVAGQAMSKTYGKSATNVLRVGLDDNYSMIDYMAHAIGSWIPQHAQQYKRGQREGIGDSRSGDPVDRSLKSAGYKKTYPIYGAFGDMAKDTRGVTGFKTKSNKIYKGLRVFERYNNNFKPKTKVHPIPPDRTFDQYKVPITMPDKTFSEYSRLSSELARRVVDEMLPHHMAGDPDSVTLKLVQRAISGGKDLIKDHLKANREAFETGDIDVDMDELEDDLKGMVRKATQSKSPEPKKIGQTQEVYDQQMEIWNQGVAARKRYDAWYRPRIRKIMK
jgi:hypothetical protein